MHFLSNLHLINNDENDQRINSMKIFQTGFISGQPLSHKINDSDEIKIKLLINDSNDSIPLYVNQLFKNMLDKTEIIIIDIGRLNDDICYIDEDGMTYYGYKSLSHIYLNNKNDSLWNNIIPLFPSLNVIRIKCIKLKYAI